MILRERDTPVWIWRERYVVDGRVLEGRVPLYRRPEVKMFIITFTTKCKLPCSSLVTYLNIKLFQIGVLTLSLPAWFEFVKTRPFFRKSVVATSVTTENKTSLSSAQSLSFDATKYHMIKFDCLDDHPRNHVLGDRNVRTERCTAVISPW